MGDRANVVLEQDNGQEIYLYSHWGGTELPETLQAALNRGRDRWDDEPYLGRIIFQDMTAGSEKELTGFGISTYLCDNEYPLLRVDSRKQTVTVDFDPVRKYHDKPNKTYSFEEFSSIGNMDWKALHYRDEVEA
jgi:hypothetical protein